MELIANHHSFGGYVQRFRHASSTLQCDMVFSIYLPPQAAAAPVPVVYWLSGLTCNDENFMQKSGVQRVAAQLGLAIVCPDTSPRGTNLPGEHDDYYFGSGAGFYLNATQAPWDKHYRMYDYVVEELPVLIQQSFPVTDRCSISGHSMGGHGALTVALKNPEIYRSVSALAPICHPCESEWGRTVFSRYLGDDEKTWRQYDTVLLIAQATKKIPLLVDQGTEDEFLSSQLQADMLQTACDEYHYPLVLRMRKGYDHSYFFVSSVIEEHLQYHAEVLANA